MKTLFAFCFALVLIFTPMTIPNGALSSSAQIFGNCEGQDTSKRWNFAVADREGNKVVFGPYRCKKACREVRNLEAKKLKWIVVGTCED